MDMGPLSRVIYLVPEPSTCTLTADRTEKFTFRGQGAQTVPREIGDMARNMNSGAAAPLFYVEDLNGKDSGSVAKPQKRETAIEQRKIEKRKAKAKASGAGPRQPDILDPLPKRRHKVVDVNNAKNG